MYKAEEINLQIFHFVDYSTGTSAGQKSRNNVTARLEAWRGGARKRRDQILPSGNLEEQQHLRSLARGSYRVAISDDGNKNSGMATETRRSRAGGFAAVAFVHN